MTAAIDATNLPDHWSRDLWEVPLAAELLRKVSHYGIGPDERGDIVSSTLLAQPDVPFVSQLAPPGWQVPDTPLVGPAAVDVRGLPGDSWGPGVGDQEASRCDADP